MMKHFLQSKKVRFFGILLLGISLVLSDLSKNNYAQFSFVSIIVLVSMLIIIGYWHWNHAFVEIDSVSMELGNLIKGLPVNTTALEERNPLIAEELAKLSDITIQATKFTQAIGKHDTDIHLDASVPLNAALLEMEQHLQKLNEEEQKRNWVTQGVAELGDIIRQNLDSKVEDLADSILYQIVKTLNANQAGIYLVEENEDDKFIHLVSCYAYDRKKIRQKRIEWGEGLIGECIRDSDMLFVTDVPADYITITSGLGQATPRNIVLCPLKTNEKTIGAIEIASFEVMEKHKTELIAKVCESLATTIVTVQNNNKNLSLLDQASKVQQTLREKENILMQNAEELTATQEELNRRLVDIQVEANLNKNILDAINKSNAMVEFDMGGRIMDANELYLNVMGYAKEELLGKTEAYLLPNDDALKQNLKMLWSSLSEGQFNSGQFKRLSKNKEEIWIEASFNPIVDINGKLMKVLMFAQFISDTLTRENDLKNKIAVMNEAVPYAELDSLLKVKNCNPLFMELFGLTRKTSKGFELIGHLGKQSNQASDFEQKLKKQMTEAKCFRTELNCVLPNGEAHELHFIFNPLKDINGKITGTGLIINEFPVKSDKEEVILKIV